MDQQNMSFSTIVSQISPIQSQDDTYKNILKEIESNYGTNSNEKTKNQNSEKKLLRQRFGIIYYILDGFQWPIRNININTMKDIWYQTEKYKFQIIQKSNQNDLLQKILQNDLEYDEIAKIIIILSTTSQSDKIYENFGFLLNLLLIEKLNQLKKQISLGFRDESHSIQSQLNVFLSKIIKSLKNLSLHLYFPILIEDLRTALEFHLHIISSPLKIIFQTSFQTIDNLADILIQFFQLSYPFKQNAENIITQEHFNYFQVLIKELITYLYFPKNIQSYDLYNMVSYIIRQVLPTYQNLI
uniref:Meiotic nuclear elongation 3 n=1 Tax=Tetrahymena thermophila TaxID=5911 RepID=A0A876Y6F4_TETTH|nr:meiotic nuclear elongation 3 [Tetrahymena thermophila]